MTTTLRAHFDGKVLVPVEPVDLPKGQLLEIDVREAGELRKGSPAALLRAIQQPPHISEDAIREWERAIEQGKIPVRFEGAFDEPGK